MAQISEPKTGDDIARIGQFLKATLALEMTPEHMTERIAGAGNAARREDQAALASTGEDKARVMAKLHAIVGSARTQAEQKNRQLWFRFEGAAIGIFAWAILPGLVAREIATAMVQAHGGGRARHALSGSRAAHDAECRPVAAPGDRRWRQHRNRQS